MRRPSRLGADGKPGRHGRGIRASSTWGVLVLAVSIRATAFPAESLLSWGEPSPFRAFLDAVTIAATSPESLRFAKESLSALAPGRAGFAVVDARAFFPEASMRRLFETLPKPSTIVVAGVDPFRPGSVLADGPKGEWTAEPLAPFDRYLDWLVAGLRRALPRDEPIELRSADLRGSARGDERNVFPEWHQDGGYLAATVSLLGPGTESRTTSPAAEGEWSELASAVDPATPTGAAARGQKLLFFCVECFHRRRDVAPTVYRSPAADTDRRFLTVRFGRRR